MANEFIARRGLIVLSNGASITGSLRVADTISGSIVSGGLFYGNGSNIFGVVSSSFATTASAATSITFVPATASFALTAASVAGLQESASWSDESAFAHSASHAVTATTAHALSFTPENATSASYALTASYASNVPVTASYALQAQSSSFADNALTANTASHAQAASVAHSLSFTPVNATSASYALTASYASNVPVTASYALQAQSASFAVTDWSAINNLPVGILSGSTQINLLTGVTASYASRSLSSSYANTDWIGIANIPSGIVSSSTQTIEHIAGQNIAPNVVSASALYVNGTVTAREFNTQLVSASIVYQSGSSKFGDTYDDVMSVTGSLQLSGSALFVGPASFQNGVQASIINGIYQFTASAVVNVGTTVVASVPTSSRDSAVFNYAVKNGANYRAGTVMSIWSASVVEFTDTSTPDIGNTNDISFTVDVVGENARLKATVGSVNGWTVKTIVNAI